MVLRVLILLIAMLFSELVLANEHGIAVSVDGSPITETDIKARSNLIIFSSGLPDNKKSYNLVRDRVIDILIDEKLIDKEAKRLEIELEPADVQDSLWNLADRNNIPRDHLDDFFKGKKIDINELKNQLMRQLLWARIVSARIQPTINILDREVAESRTGIERAAKSAAEISELKLAEIVLFYQKESDIEKNKVFAEKLVAQIKQGAKFGALAREFSQSQSAKSYGEIGWIASNQIQPEIARKLTRMNIGGMEIIDLPDGVHIFKLLDKKLISSVEKTLNEQDIKSLLIEKKLEIAVKSYLRKLRKNSHIQFYTK
jgi:peptidyl-prolyl cis-trans isomerase SurA